MSLQVCAMSLSVRFLCHKTVTKLLILCRIKLCWQIKKGKKAYFLTEKMFFFDFFVTLHAISNNIRYSYLLQTYNGTVTRKIQKLS